MTRRHPSIPSARVLRLSQPFHNYDLTSIVLHWSMAVLILLDWMLGQGRGFAEPGAARAGVLSWHMLLGIGIGVILIARVLWRIFAGRHFGFEPGPLGRVAMAAHAGLYVLMIATVLAGFSAAIARGTPIFNVLLPALPPLLILHWFAGFHSIFADSLAFSRPCTQARR